MTKRRRLVLESAVLVLGFFATQFIDISLRYWAIGILGLITYFLTAFVLKEDLTKVGWITALVPPAAYVVLTNLFYFLLPQNLAIKILIFILFGIGLYAVLLTENIFSVASSFRTIKLLRAAQAVGFFISLVTAFFGYNAVFSFRTDAWFNFGLVFAISLPLILPSLWSISLEEKIVSRLVIYSLILSFILAQMAFFISFWPLTITTASLFLVSSLYVGLGIMQSQFSGRLFENTLREFLQVGIVIFIITFFLAHWG